MKKFLLILSAAMITAVVSGINPRFTCLKTKGLFSDAAFTPLQLSVFPIDKAQLFDGKTHCLFAVGLFLVDQQSTIISFAPFLCSYNNYFLKAGLLNISVHNRALAVAPVNFDGKNYGLQVGVFNGTAYQEYGMQAGIYNKHGMIQLGGFNIYGRFQIGLRNKGYKTYDQKPEEKDEMEIQLGILNTCKKSGVQFGIINGSGMFQSGLCNINDSNGFQFGIFNASIVLYDKKTSFQIGLLNYNSRSCVPWLPFVNWDMGKQIKDETGK